MAEEFTTTRIKVSDLDAIREMAEQGHRSPVQQLTLMVEIFKKFHIDPLPRPADAQPVPVIYIPAHADPATQAA